MGCAVTGFTLDVYGTTSGTPRWRVNRVLALASGEGGSELGSLSSTNDAIAFFGRVFGLDTRIVTSSLRYTTPGVVRPAYDHNDTAGSPWFHVAGYNGDFFSSGLLPGQDDGVVAFHSACGYVKVFSSTECSNDWEWVLKTAGAFPTTSSARWRSGPTTIASSTAAAMAAITRTCSSPTANSRTWPPSPIRSGRPAAAVRVAAPPAAAFPSDDDHHFRSDHVSNNKKTLVLALLGLGMAALWFQLRGHQPPSHRTGNPGPSQSPLTAKPAVRPFPQPRRLSSFRPMRPCRPR